VHLILEEIYRSGYKRYKLALEGYKGYYLALDYTLFTVYETSLFIPFILHISNYTDINTLYPYTGIFSYTGIGQPYPSALRAEFWVEILVQTLKRVTKCPMGKYPCQTAVIHLTTAAACNVLERENPAVVALLNIIDAECKLEPEVLSHEQFLNFEQQDGTLKHGLDEDGVQLLGNGRGASAQDVRDTFNT
jgi:hypothetical protein